MIKRIFNKKGNTNQTSQTCSNANPNNVATANNGPQASNSEQTTSMNVDEVNDNCNNVTSCKPEESKRTYSYFFNVSKMPILGL